MKKTACALCLALMLLLSACGSKGAESVLDIYGSASEKMTMTENELGLTGKPAVSSMLVTKASGKVVYKNSKARMDASNARDGYVMIKYTAATAKRIKVLITGPSSVRYSYNITPGGDYTAFPLSDGSGKYTIGVYKQTTADKYAAELSKTMNVKLDDEFAPFLRPNQYVNYSPDSKAVAIAKKLTSSCATDIDKISSVYNYVISHLTYDYAKAETVESGYLCDIDAILASGKGICYDYAAVMTAMLRSQGIPTKLVVGYTSSMYHAWINVYTSDGGWIDGVIYFDGTTWKLMDPTFASSSGSSSSIMQYIGDPNNYSAKYLY